MKLTISNWIDIGNSFLTLTAIIATSKFAYINIKLLRKANEAQRKEQTTKYRSDTLAQICLGLLTQRDDMLQYGIDARKRLVENGFYDGIRAFLGDMMNLPYYSSSTLEKAKQNKQLNYFFELGPMRFGMTWNDLFIKFQDVCDSMEIESGLEEYFDGTKCHEYHKRTIERKDIKEARMRLEKEAIERTKRSDHGPTASASAGVSLIVGFPSFPINSYPEPSGSTCDMSTGTVMFETLSTDNKPPAVKFDLYKIEEKKNKENFINNISKSNKPKRKKKSGR